MSVQMAQRLITHGEAVRVKAHDRVIYVDTLSPGLTSVPYGPGSPGARLPVLADLDPVAGHRPRIVSTFPVRPTGVQLRTPAALTPCPTRWENYRA